MVGVGARSSLVMRLVAMRKWERLVEARVRRGPLRRAVARSVGFRRDQYRRRSRAVREVAFGELVRFPELICASGGAFRAEQSVRGRLRRECSGWGRGGPFAGGGGR